MGKTSKNPHKRAKRLRDEDLLATTIHDDDSLVPLPLNLRCKNSVQQLCGWKKGELKIPLNYCCSVEHVKRFRNMTKEQQKTARKNWSSLPKMEQAKIKAEIPGDDCLCCVRQPRSDKGIKKSDDWLPGETKNERQGRKLKERREEDPAYKKKTNEQAKNAGREARKCPVKRARANEVWRAYYANLTPIRKGFRNHADKKHYYKKSEQMVLDTVRVDSDTPPPLPVNKKKRKESQGGRASPAKKKTTDNRKPPPPPSSPPSPSSSSGEDAGSPSPPRKKKRIKKKKAPPPRPPSPPSSPDRKPSAGKPVARTSSKKSSMTTTPLPERVATHPRQVAPESVGTIQAFYGEGGTHHASVSASLSNNEVPIELRAMFSTNAAYMASLKEATEKEDAWKLKEQEMTILRMQEDERRVAEDHRSAMLSMQVAARNDRDTIRSLLTNQATMMSLLTNQATMMSLVPPPEPVRPSLPIPVVPKLEASTPLLVSTAEGSTPVKVAVVPEPVVSGPVLPAIVVSATPSVVVPTPPVVPAPPLVVVPSSAGVVVPTPPVVSAQRAVLVPTPPVVVVPAPPVVVVPLPPVVDGPGPGALVLPVLPDRRAPASLVVPDPAVPFPPGAVPAVDKPIPLMDVSDTAEIGLLLEPLPVGAGVEPGTLPDVVRATGTPEVAADVLPSTPLRAQREFDETDRIRAMSPLASPFSRPSLTASSLTQASRGSIPPDEDGGDSPASSEKNIGDSGGEDVLSGGDDVQSIQSGEVQSGGGGESPTEEAAAADDDEDINFEDLGDSSSGVDEEEEDDASDTGENNASTEEPRVHTRSGREVPKNEAPPAGVAKAKKEAEEEREGESKLPVWKWNPNISFGEPC